MQKFNQTVALALLAVLSMVGAPAMAAVDVTGIAAAGTDIAAVGAAVFLIYIAVKLVKWVRRAL